MNYSFLFILNYKYRTLQFIKKQIGTIPTYQFSLGLFLPVRKKRGRVFPAYPCRLGFRSFNAYFFFVAAFVALLSFAIFKQLTRAPVFRNFEHLTLEEATK